MLKVLEIAQGEIGYLEKASLASLDDKTGNAGSANLTKYARDHARWGTYHANKQGLAWCDMFVDWCFITAYGFEMAMQMTCQEVGAWGAGCTESAKYYKAQSRFHWGSPQVGDQIFFTNNGGNTMYHTGLVVGVDGNMVYTIEGNTSGAPGVVENGGAVAKKSYSLSYSKIAGYGRPKYDMVGGDREVVEMTIYNKIEDVPSWYREAVQKALDKGVIKGTGKGLGLSEETCKTLTILARLAVI